MGIWVKGTDIPSSTVAISLLCVWPLRLALSPKGGYTVRPLLVHIRRAMVPTCIHHRGVPAHPTWSLRSLQWERWTGSQSTAVIQWRWPTKPMVTHPVIISDAMSLKVVLAVCPQQPAQWQGTTGCTTLIPLSKFSPGAPLMVAQFSTVTWLG